MFLSLDFFAIFFSDFGCNCHNEWAIKNPSHTINLGLAAEEAEHDPFNPIENYQQKTGQKNFQKCSNSVFEKSKKKKKNLII